MYELNDKEKRMLLKRRKIIYKVIQDADVQKDSWNRESLCPTKSYTRCWCETSAGERIDEGSFCPHCGREADYFRVANKNVLAKVENPKYVYTQDHLTLDNFFYVRKHAEKENALEILKVTLTLKAGKIRHDEEELVWKVNHIIEIIPNEKCRAYKMVRGKEVDVDMFDAFQINSKLIISPPSLLFEDSLGPIDFMLNNRKTNQYTGFLQCFNLADILVPRNSFFMLYMYLYAQYPVVEFVVKMGYISLISQIMKDLVKGCNKEQIRGKANLLTKILNIEATNGSMALTVPRYIADDLNAKEASVEEYIIWGDICQMSDAKDTSKENYMAITRTSIYHALKYRYYEIPNIMKYGYSVKDIIKFLEKQKERNGVHHVAYYTNLWTDYLNMCDLMGIEHDKFPMDIKSAHDNVAMAFKAKQNAMVDKAIDVIAKEAEKHIPDNKQYNDSDYIIILPHSINDVVQEGQMQHNCVGSYVDKIAKRKSIVFFIRKKDDPTQSFVTAEFARGRLNQIFYKNNRSVSDKEIRDIAADFCDKLSKTTII